MKASLLPLLSALVVLLVAAMLLAGPAPTTLDDFFLPGSQPNQSGQLEHPEKCDNCHGGYDAAVEPAFNWRGSMMSQAARDPLYFATVAIANQDAPESGDLCIRCHSPAGWLEGRSTPTDGSALNNNDREGVQCDFCHKLVTPTPLGVNPYPNDPDYTADTYAEDQAYLATLSDIPPASANGMYVADASNRKRGPFIDAAARHKMLYSPFHAESALCGTCHDVSNPAFSKQADGSYAPNDFGVQAPDFDPYALFPVERTYSEWLNSEYNTPQGVYAPEFGGNKEFVSTCQDCHMRDVSGVAANKKGTKFRHDLPLHDMTGGNTFVPGLIDNVYPGETDPAALAAGVERARGMLQLAAKLEFVGEPIVTAAGLEFTVRVTNETGHKLPSGYPEGRRIWLNVRGYDTAGALVYESGAYDVSTGVLTHDADLKIYEIKPGISTDLAGTLGLPAGPSFHFVLNNTVYSDNRIPPRGFTNAAFEAIQSPPVAYSYSDGQHWDETSYLIPGAEGVEVTLYYQTTSKEYVEFLRDENVTNDWGNVMYGLWESHGKSAPEEMAEISYGGVEPPEPSDPEVFVESITVTRERKGKSWNGVATVAVVDDGGLAVPGATVYGSFDAPNSSVKSGTTNTQGEVVLRSDKTRTAPSVWCFTLTDVTDDDAAYTGGSTTVCEGAGKRGLAEETPAATALEQNYPNPFNPSTTIAFTLAKPSQVSVTVHDMTGRLVATVADGALGAGRHEVVWDARGMPSGTYVCRLIADDQVILKQMTLLK